MGLVKCFDVVTMLTDEVKEHLGNPVIENVDKKNELQKSCEMIDVVAQQFGGFSYDVEVNEQTMEISISFVCEEFETSVGSEFCDLLGRAKKERFRVSGEDRIELTFVFNGIWNHVLEEGFHE